MTAILEVTGVLTELSRTLKDAQQKKEKEDAGVAPQSAGKTSRQMFGLVFRALGSKVTSDGTVRDVQNTINSTRKRNKEYKKRELNELKKREGDK